MIEMEHAPDETNGARISISGVHDFSRSLGVILGIVPICTIKPPFNTPWTNLGSPVCVSEKPRTILIIVQKIGSNSHVTGERGVERKSNAILNFVNPRRLWVNIRDTVSRIIDPPGEIPALNVQGNKRKPSLLVGKI
jgi:hypothetical protein